jgi:hypothetical protein
VDCIRYYTKFGFERMYLFCYNVTKQTVFIIYFYTIVYYINYLTIVYKWYIADVFESSLV